MSLTERALRATTYRFVTSATLPELAASAATLAPNNESRLSGWGSAYDSNDPFGVFGTVPVLENINVLAEGPAQAVLALRYYWWEYSEQQQLVLGYDHRVPQAYRLRSFDVVIARSKLPGHLSAFILSRDQDLLDSRAVPALSELIAAADNNARVDTEGNDLKVSDPDFYLWLIDVARRRDSFGDHWELDKIRVVESKDASLRGTALSQGVDTTRFEMLTLIALVDASFGPAKLKVLNTATRANYDFEITAAGQVAIHNSETHIPEHVVRSDVGPRAFFDVALSIVPSLLHAYEHDNAWDDGGRDAFVSFCRYQLNGPTISIEVPSPDLASSTVFYKAQLGFESTDENRLRLGSLEVQLVPAEATPPVALRLTVPAPAAILDRLHDENVPVEVLDEKRFSATDPGGSTITIQTL